MFGVQLAKIGLFVLWFDLKSKAENFQTSLNVFLIYNILKYFTKALTKYGYCAI